MVKNSLFTERKRLYIKDRHKEKYRRIIVYINIYYKIKGLQKIIEVLKQNKITIFLWLNQKIANR